LQVNKIKTRLSKSIETTSIFSSAVSNLFSSASDMSAYMHVTRSPSMECVLICVAGRDNLQQMPTETETSQHVVCNYNQKFESK